MEFKDAFVGLLFLVVGVFLLQGMGVLNFSTTTAPVSERTVITETGSNCPDDGVTTVNVKVWDRYSATATQVTSGQIYAKNMKSGVIEKNTSATSGWASLNLQCGESYKLYKVASAENSGSAESEIFTAQGDQMYKNLYTDSLSNMQLRVKDITSDSYYYLFADGTTNGANATTYSDLNNTNVFSSSGGADISVGTDGYLDLYLYVKSANARKYGNDKGEIENTPIGFKNYLCFDEGTDGEWDESNAVVAVNDGSALPNVIGTIDTESRRYSLVQNSEGCYEIGDIADTPKKIRFYLKAESGQDPDTSNDDVKICLFSEGYYKSSKNPNEIMKGIFTDGTTQSPVIYSGEVPCLTLNIA